MDEWKIDAYPGKCISSKIRCYLKGILGADKRSARNRREESRAKICESDLIHLKEHRSTDSW